MDRLRPSVALRGPKHLALVNGTHRSLSVARLQAQRPYFSIHRGGPERQLLLIPRSRHTHQFKWAGSAWGV